MIDSQQNRENDDLVGTDSEVLNSVFSPHLCPSQYKYKQDHHSL